MSATSGAALFRSDDMRYAAYRSPRSCSRSILMLKPGMGPTVGATGRPPSSRRSPSSRNSPAALRRDLRGHLRLVELQRREPRVEAALADELGVGTGRDDPPLVHDDDPVGLEDRRE